MKKTDKLGVLVSTPVIIRGMILIAVSIFSYTETASGIATIAFFTFIGIPITITLWLIPTITAAIILYYITFKFYSRLGPPWQDISWIIAAGITVIIFFILPLAINLTNIYLAKENFIPNMALQEVHADIDTVAIVRTGFDENRAEGKVKCDVTCKDFLDQSVVKNIIIRTGDQNLEGNLLSPPYTTFTVGYKYFGRRCDEYQKHGCVDTKIVNLIIHKVSHNNEQEACCSGVKTISTTMFLLTNGKYREIYRGNQGSYKRISVPLLLSEQTNNEIIMGFKPGIPSSTVPVPALWNRKVLSIKELVTRVSGTKPF